MIHKVRCALKLCGDNLHIFAKKFGILMLFSTLALAPLAIAHPHEAKLLIIGLFSGRVIELIGEAFAEVV